MLPNDPIANLQREIAAGFLEVLTGKTKAESIADKAYRDTEDVPSFGKADRLHILLERIQRTMGDDLNDEDQAAIIRACRRKVGLA